MITKFIDKQKFSNEQEEIIFNDYKYYDVVVNENETKLVLIDKNNSVYFIIGDDKINEFLNR